MNNFEPSKQTIGELFQKNISLTIPRFQRSYEWKLANVDDFYNDFVKVSDDRINFLGNIVIDRSVEGERQVIDGQQRLITTTILFAAIRDHLREEVKTDDANDFASEIDKTFIKHGSFAQTDNLFRFRPAADLRSFFENYVQIGGQTARSSTRAVTQSEKNVSSAYSRFRHLLKDNIQSHQYDNLKKKVLEVSNISLIVIEIFDQDMAFAIFESFNAKRVDLSVADLVKNYYFSRLGKNAQLNEKTMDNWDGIISNLDMVTKIDRFFYQYMQSYSGKFSKNQLYRRIRSSIELDHQIFIREFELNANILVALKNADIGDIAKVNNTTRVNAMLDNLKMFNVEQCYTLLLSVFRNSKQFSPRYIEKIIELIENFTFIYSKIANEQANLLEDIYVRYANEIEKTFSETSDVSKKQEDIAGRFYNKLRNDLNEIIPDEDTFTNRFVQLDYLKQKKLIKYVFTKIEDIKSNGGVSLGYAANIDHIFPQNPPSGHKRLQLVNKIGNLVPIDALTNSTIGNKLPKDKTRIYSTITNTQAQALTVLLNDNEGNFNDDVINERGKALAKEAYDIWRLTR